jgi:hypothetical protein
MKVRAARRTELVTHFLNLIQQFMYKKKVILVYSKKTFIATSILSGLNFGYLALNQVAYMFVVVQ